MAKGIEEVGVGDGNEKNEMMKVAVGTGIGWPTFCALVTVVMLVTVVAAVIVGNIIFRCKYCEVGLEREMWHMHTSVL